MSVSLRLVLLAVVIAILEIAITQGLISRYAVALPSDIALSLPKLFTDEELTGRLIMTLTEALSATALATLVGVPVGLCFFRVSDLDLAFRSWVAIAASAPLILLYPLFLVVFGRNAGTIIAMGAVAAIPPIILKTRDGFVGMRQVYVDVGRSFRVSRRTQFWKIMIPAAAPTILNGIRIGLVFALVNIVAVEYLIDFGGLGQLVGLMADRFYIPGMYGSIMFVIVVSAFFYTVTERLERWVRPC